MTRRLSLVALAGFAVLATAYELMYTGIYGLTLFALVPVAIGAIAALLLHSRTIGQAALHGAATVICLTCALVVVRIEGAFCVMMVLPLAALLGALGGALACWLTPSRSGGAATAMMALLPVATLTFDLTARPPVFEVRTEVEIAATPGQVWKHVIAFPELPPPAEWYFRSGIAYPIRASIEGSGPGAIRRCEFSTGPFVEPIQVWDEPRLLQFSVTANPAPMNELSPWSDVTPNHLHGYFISKKGQFRLTLLPGGHTLLEGTTWYQHGLWPAQYWRWWSDAIIHRIHLRVLHHIKTLAEQGSVATPLPAR